MFSPISRRRVVPTDRDHTETTPTAHFISAVHAEDLRVTVRANHRGVEVRRPRAAHRTPRDYAEFDCCCVLASRAASARSWGVSVPDRSDRTSHSLDDRSADRIRARTSRSSESGAMNTVRNTATSSLRMTALLCGHRHGPSCSAAPQRAVVTAAPSASG